MAEKSNPQPGEQGDLFANTCLWNFLENKPLVPLQKAAINNVAMLHSVDASCFKGFFEKNSSSPVWGFLTPVWNDQLVQSLRVYPKRG